MEEWEQVEIEVVTDGLDASPSELHAAFEISGDHLNEVRDRHTMMQFLLEKYRNHTWQKLHLNVG